MGGKTNNTESDSEAMGMVDEGDSGRRNTNTKKMKQNSTLKKVNVDDIEFEMNDLHNKPIKIDENDGATSVYSDFTVKKGKQRQFLEFRFQPNKLN